MTSDSAWHFPDAWRAAAQVVRDGLGDLETATISGGSGATRYSGGFELDFRAFRAALNSAQAAEGLGSRTFELTVSRNGGFSVVFFDRPEDEELVFVPGALPLPFRTPPATVSAPAATNDLESLRAQVSERLENAQPGCSEDELDALEELVGIPLPPELRVLWSVARRGDVIFRMPVAADAANDEGEDEYEEQGWRLSIPDALDLRTASSRFPGWKFGATEVLEPRLGDPVQPLAASPGWIPFGDDWGGNLYCLDLTPAPTGHVGQIIQLDHERSTGADLVAHSLTDFAANVRSSFTPPDVRRPTRAALLTDKAPLPMERLAEERALEVLRVNSPTKPADLSPFADFPALRTLIVVKGSQVDLAQVAALPALEYLSMGPAEWEEMLASGALPPGLLAAGVDEDFGSEAADVRALEDRLRAAYGVPIPARTLIEGQLENTTPA